MKLDIPKTAKVDAPKVNETRGPDAPLDEGSAEAFRTVQPAGFKDHPDSSLAAAVVDPDVQDSEGGE